VPWHYEDGLSTTLGHSTIWANSDMELYGREFAKDDVWNLAAAANPRLGRALDFSTLVSDEEFASSRLHNEFLRPMGDDLWRGLAVTSQNGKGRGGIAFHRGKGLNGFSDASVATIDELAPHLARMLSIRSRFAQLEHRCDARGALIDGLAIPLFLLSAGGRLIEANAAGEALIKSGVLFIRAGLLYPAARQCRQAFHDALARAAAPRAPEASAIALPSADGPVDLSFIAVPGHGSGPRRVTMLASPRLPDRTAEARLRALHALSPSEATLAVMLAEGATPADIADARGVSVGTVRFQIKAISAKLNCHRQSDIVRIVKSLPPLRGDP
jgi:DNA-binding CsgD family transcriptional regulator